MLVEGLVNVIALSGRGSNKLSVHTHTRGCSKKQKDNGTSVDEVLSQTHLQGRQSKKKLLNDYKDLMP